MIIVLQRIYVYVYKKIKQHSIVTCCSRFVTQSIHFKLMFHFLQITVSLQPVNAPGMNLHVFLIVSQNNHNLDKYHNLLVKSSSS